MKIIYFYIVIFVASVGLVFLFFNRSAPAKSEMYEADKNKGSVIENSVIDDIVLSTQKNNEGPVTVVITPRITRYFDDSEKNKLKKINFEIVLDTHSVDLSEDLMDSAVLVIEEKEYYPIAWNGDPLGGHHRIGILLFEFDRSPEISISPFSIQLNIKNIGGISEKSFYWIIEDNLQFINNSL